MRVAIIMGSTSDLPKMEAAVDILKSYGVAVDVRCLSAHRAHAGLSAFIEEANNNGTEVFITAAGMAAALIMLVLLPMSGSKEADRDLIAVKEQKQIEALQEWEEKQEREVQTREKRNKILEEGKNAAEKKVADILDFLNVIWKKEAEEM